MFVFISEIFPNAVRAKGQSLGIFVHWSLAALITWRFPVYAKAGLANWVFAFLAAMMVLQSLRGRSCPRPRAPRWKTWDHKPAGQNRA